MSTNLNTSNNLIEIPFYRVDVEGNKIPCKITLEQDTRCFVSETVEEVDPQKTMFTDNPAMNNIPYVIDQKKLISDIIDNMDEDKGLNLACMKSIRDSYNTDLRYLQLRDSYTQDDVNALKKTVAIRFFSSALKEQSQKHSSKK